MRLFDTGDDANWQARATLAYLNSRSLDAESAHKWEHPTVDRWHNCREQGYVISFTNRAGAQLNIAFFEHGNSDAICAVQWVQTTMNPPTIETMDTGGTVYKNKHDVSISFDYGQIVKMGDWIQERLQQHWDAGLRAKKAS